MSQAWFSGEYSNTNEVIHRLKTTDTCKPAQAVHKGDGMQCQSNCSKQNFQKNILIRNKTKNLAEFQQLYCRV